MHAPIKKKNSYGNVSHKKESPDYGDYSKSKSISSKSYHKEEISQYFFIKYKSYYIKFKQWVVINE